MLSVTCNEVSKFFAERAVLKQVTIEFPARSVVQIKGGNGAGKTTLLRLVQGELTPTIGTVEFFSGGKAVARRKVRSQIRMLSAEPLLYPHLSLRDNLRLFAAAYGETSSVLDEKISALKLEPLLESKLITLSLGELRRASFLRCLLGEPQLLLLDEPFSNLDSWWRNFFVSELLRLKNAGVSMIIVSHESLSNHELVDRSFELVSGRLHNMHTVTHADRMRG